MPPDQDNYARGTVSAAEMLGRVRSPTYRPVGTVAATVQFGNVYRNQLSPAQPHISAAPADDLMSCAGICCDQKLAVRRQRHACEIADQTDASEYPGVRARLFTGSMCAVIRPAYVSNANWNSQ